MIAKDQLCRSIVHPKFMNAGVLDEEQFFQFGESKSEPGVYVVSIASAYILGSLDAIHEYGGGIAKASNDRFRMNTGQDPNPEACYLGFFHLRCREILNTDCEHYRISVKWQPELGCEAHFEIELSLSNSDASKAARRSCRRKTAGKLHNQSLGPQLMSSASYTEEQMDCLRNLDWTRHLTS